MKIKVPFYKQTTEKNCGPVALKMALEFLGKQFSVEEIEKAANTKEKESVFTIQLAIAARRLGFNAEFYSKNLRLNEESLKLEFYKKNTSLVSKDIDNFLKEAEKLGVKSYKRQVTNEEITSLISGNSVPIIILDWSIVIEKPERGFVGHFVPVVGYNKESFYVHNHGFLNPKPFLKIKKDIFEKARKSLGTDEDILIIKKP